MGLFKLKSLSLVRRYLFFIVPIIIIAIAVISLTSYRFARQELIDNLHREMLLQAKETASRMNELLIKEKTLAQGLAKAVEEIVQETYIAEDYEKLLVRFVKISPETAGMGIWFRQDVFPGIKKAAPYAFREGEKVVASDEYTTNDFNIWTSEWYKAGTAGKDGGWTEAYKDTVSGVSMTTISYPIYHEIQGSLMGCITVDMDISSLKEAVHEMKIGYEGKPFLISDTGAFLAGVADDKLMITKIQDNANAQVAQSMRSVLVSGKSGFFEFEDNGRELFVFYAPVQETGWYVVLKFEKRKVLSNIQNLLIFFVAAGLISIVVMSLAIYFFTRSLIVRPLNDVTTKLRQSEGDLTMRLSLNSKDELGEFASWFNVFIEKMQTIVTQVSKNTHEVNDASYNLTDITAQLSSHAATTSDRVNNVAAMTEELNTNIVTTVAAAMEQSTTNMSTVANASEELSVTVSRIAGNVEDAARISGSAVQQAQETVERMGELEKAARSISKVTETITDISDKTNLLALNATIEAARAGESGKGFAVVATEIKELAAQTSEATNDIKNQINGVQESSKISISAIDGIVKIINQINGIISTITTAVEEQSVSTREITANIIQVNQGFMEINANVNQGTSLLGEISNDIAEVSEASQQIAKGNSDLTSQAGQLLELSMVLNDMVNSFKI